MSQRTRSEGAAREEHPMEIDDGDRGLEQSRHHPNHQQASFNVPTDDPPNEHRDNRDLEAKLYGTFIGAGVPGPPRRLLEGLTHLFITELTERENALTQQRQHNETNGSNEAAITANAIKEAVRQAFAEQQAAKPSWAAVAASGTESEPKTQNDQSHKAAKQVPARQAREVVIRAANLPEELANRTPREVVQAVNTAAGKDGAVAARRLRSGDTVVTFENGSKGYYTANTTWVTKAFGEGATITQRTYAVLVKGMPKSVLQKRDRTELAKSIEKDNKTPITRCHPKIPRNEGATKASLLLEVGNVEAARDLCNHGVLFEAVIYHAEPFSPELNPTRCYRCQEYGHKAKFCEKEARYARYALAAHPRGEDECGHGKGDVPLRCVNCGSNHAAWSRECQRYKELATRAREAYKVRPITYAVANVEHAETTS